MFNSEEVLICWILNQIKVRGNERAESVAKSALDLVSDKLDIPYTDLKPKISRFLFTKCQQSGITTSTINSSWWNPLWENLDQLSKNPKRNKPLYPYYALVTQDLHSPLYSNQNNFSVYYVKHSVVLNMFSCNVELSFSSENFFKRKWYEKSVWKYQHSVIMFFLTELYHKIKHKPNQ